MNRNKYQAITEEKFKQAINEEYQIAKRLSKPLLNGVNRSFVKFYWGKKLRTHGGSCSYWSKVIVMNAKYRDVGTGKWSYENFLMTLRHEIAHLATRHERGHGAVFLNVLKLLKGHRYVGAEVYEGPKKDK